MNELNSYAREELKAKLDYPKTYLGDSVYAEIEDGMLKLTTEDGIRATNTIYLELEIYTALVSYIERIRKGATG